MSGEPSSTAAAGDAQPQDHEVIDSGVLLTRLRLQRLSRNAILDVLMKDGLTLDEATDVVDGDLSVRLVRSEGRLSVLSAPPVRAPVGTDPLFGLWGWLLLPAIQLVAAPFVLLRDLREGLELIRALDESAAVPAGVRGLLVTAVALDAALLALCLVTGWYFFRMKRAAPKLYIALVASGFLVVCIMVYGAAALRGLEGSDLRLLFGRAVATAAWTAYFLLSTRVRNTFIR